MLGIEVPIFAFSHCRDVIVEVTKAGGFGVLGASTGSPEQLETELRWIDAHVNGRPYGVDVIIPSTYDREAERAAIERSWSEARAVLKLGEPGLGKSRLLASRRR